MADVFISFIHEDHFIANGIRSLLEFELGLHANVFLSADQQQIFAGEKWVEKVIANLQAAKVVILLFSKKSIGRPWVNFEAGGAWCMGKAVVPCCFGNQKVDAMPHPYSALQAVDLMTSPYYLVQSVHHHLKMPTSVPPNPFWAKFETIPSGGPKSDTVHYDYLLSVLAMHQDAA